MFRHACKNSSPNHIAPVPVERRRVLRANVSPSSATTVGARMKLPHSQCPKRSNKPFAASEKHGLARNSIAISEFPLYPLSG